MEQMLLFIRIIFQRVNCVEYVYVVRYFPEAGE